MRGVDGYFIVKMWKILSFLYLNYQTMVQFSREVGRSRVSYDLAIVSLCTALSWRLYCRLLGDLI